MSRFKKISIFIMCIVVLIVYLCNDRLISFAEEIIYNRSTLKGGMVFKSGDYFSFDDGNNYSGCDGFQLTYEFNGVKYKSSIGTNGKLTMPKSGYYRKSFERYRDFTQEEGKMPYVNGQTVYWEVIEHSYYDPYYCDLGYEFKGYSYIEPSFNIYCDDDKIAANDNTNCQVTIDYVHTPNIVSFDIVSDKFDITNVTPGKGWKLNDEGSLVLEALDIEKNPYLDSSNEIDLVEFTVNSKDKKVVFDSKAIVVDNLKWKDEIKTDEYNDLEEELIQQMEVTKEENITTTVRSTTTTTTKKHTEEKVTNPKTGINDYFIVYVIFGLLLVSLAYELKKKDLFKKL